MSAGHGCRVIRPMVWSRRCWSWPFSRIEWACPADQRTVGRGAEVNRGNEGDLAGTWRQQIWPLPVDQDQFGRGSRPAAVAGRVGPDPVARTHIIRTSTASGDGARKVAADREREGGRCWPGTRAHEGVHLVDCDCLHLHQHLPGARRGVGKIAIADPADTNATEPVQIGRAITPPWRSPPSYPARAGVGPRS